MVLDISNCDKSDEKKIFRYRVTKKVKFTEETRKRKSCEYGRSFPVNHIFNYDYRSLFACACALNPLGPSLCSPVPGNGTSPALAMVPFRPFQW